MNEPELIEKLRERVSLPRTAGVVLGIGDDCAIVRPRGTREDWLYTTDMLIEGIHFLRETHGAADVGWKALARGLSDIAAMGGEARFCLLSLALASWVDARWLDGFYDGLLALAERAGRAGVALIGGDLARTELVMCDIVVAFEAYGSGKVGPDLTVTYRGKRSFNLEVTRLRRVPDANDFGPPLLAKLRQLPPSLPNAVLVAIGGRSAQALDVAGATRALRSRADAKDETLFARRGFEGTRGFYDRYLRLGGVLVWCEGSVGDARAALWINRSARIPLPERDIRAVLRCLRKDA